MVSTAGRVRAPGTSGLDEGSPILYFHKSETEETREGSDAVLLSDDWVVLMRACNASCCKAMVMRKYRVSCRTDEILLPPIPVFPYLLGSANYFRLLEQSVAPVVARNLL